MPREWLTVSSSSIFVLILTEIYAQLFSELFAHCTYT